ncbi:PHP domain-containing protein, partial [Acetomicrobium mobile]|uniref:PHP domain-containing protein n=1 Tax=Acetomicrobium mobile TaxID=97477 RepID=UPI0026F00EBF
MLIDLHVHSTASDGTLSPSNLASKAKEKGISLLSLTDHDTTGGLKEFERACVVNKLAGLSGIELSAEHRCIVH